MQRWHNYNSNTYYNENDRNNYYNKNCNDNNNDNIHNDNNDNDDNNVYDYNVMIITFQYEDENGDDIAQNCENNKKYEGKIKIHNDDKSRHCIIKY